MAPISPCMMDYRSASRLPVTNSAGGWRSRNSPLLSRLKDRCGQHGGVRPICHLSMARIRRGIAKSAADRLIVLRDHLHSVPRQEDCQCLRSVCIGYVLRHFLGFVVCRYCGLLCDLLSHLDNLALGWRAALECLPNGLTHDGRDRRKRENLVSFANGDPVRDVAISAGKIAAVAPNITASAADTIDARGKIVAPGLIDIHTHAGRSKEGPPMCLQDGVTGWVDAGSGGADNMDEVAAVARGAPQIGRCLINIARTGVAPGELQDLTRANVDLARGAIARNRDVVIGVKARMSNNVAGANDLEALRRAQAAADSLPVMIHVGQNYSPLRSYLSLLKRGDIVTHIHAPAPNGLLDDKGKLIPEVMQARRRGILFDFGNGTTDHFDWATVEAATKQDFWPDTFSTDWSTMSRTTGVIDMPNVMSKLLMFGMPLSARSFDMTFGMSI